MLLFITGLSHISFRKKQSGIAKREHVFNVPVYYCWYEDAKLTETNRNNTTDEIQLNTCIERYVLWNFRAVNAQSYKVVQIWPGLFILVYTQISPGHIRTTLYLKIKSPVAPEDNSELHIVRSMGTQIFQKSRATSEFEARKRWYEATSNIGAHKQAY
jgi:hypothetical protein